jgi:predicted transcriptional regulator
MSDEQAATRSETLALTAEIVSAHLSNNVLAGAEVPGLIQTVFDTLPALGRDEPTTPVVLTPAVPIKRSVTDDYIVCLEDGKKLKTLKRHLMTAYDMTPEQYRVKWGLPPDYPMVAPSYSRTRKEMAKAIGLGRKPAPAPAPEPKSGSRRSKAKAA